MDGRKGSRSWGRRGVLSQARFCDSCAENRFPLNSERVQSSASLTVCCGRAKPMLRYLVLSAPIRPPQRATHPQACNHKTQILGPAQPKATPDLIKVLL